MELAEMEVRILKEIRYVFFKKRVGQLFTKKLLAKKIARVYEEELQYTCPNLDEIVDSVISYMLERGVCEPSADKEGSYVVTDNRCVMDELKNLIKQRIKEDSTVTSTWKEDRKRYVECR